ncbi:LacI family DNA-binding transcriptional regulator [Paenibacillus albidus]|uniref:LacI family DNA-binding transcriptional regulator n=1 Tax=Paenibacillus albidus TaxID=2041023 RepID=UPI001BE9D77D|nr:LacI family DNA-binding transcriptional regulator [Paenibacillus albidus]MBT2292020.1 LacI family DNA-binding transcriptional regulator [Paenibacillus albidus]
MSKKRTTSFDVARHAGVSRSVVSAVLNGTQGIGVSPEKRQLVLDAIKELNYHVDSQARSMKTGKSGCIAVYGDMERPMFLQLLAGVKSACSASGYYVMLNKAASGERMESRHELLDLYYQKRIDGAISLDATSYADPIWAEAVLEAGMPYVSVEGYAEDERISSVQTDYRQSLREALAYMHRGGSVPLYLNIQVGGSAEALGERQRLEAYIRWCEEAGVQAEVVDCHLAELDEDDIQARVLEIIRDRARRTLLANWSVGAFAVYRAAWQMDLRIGREVQVMAADNTYQVNQRLVPALSSMEIPYYRMGVQAVDLVNLQLDSTGAMRRQIKIQADLLKGESC